MKRYRPVPLVKLLRDMMTYAGIALDLGFYAVAYQDGAASFEVSQLEKLAYSLWEKAVIEASLAVRDYDDAFSMISVFRVVDCLLRVVDVAADFSSLVLRGLTPPRILREALIAGVEVTAPLKISRRVRVCDIEDEGVDVLAVRRGSEWILAPGDDVVLEPGDVAILRGSPENVAKLANIRIESGEGGEVGRETLRLKKLADILLDLGFYSIIYGDEVVALQVQEIEHRLDDEIIMYYELVSKLGLSPPEEYTMHKFAEMVEEVSDVAASMAILVRTHMPIHKVIAVAEDQSQEKIIALEYRGSGRIRLSDTGLIDEEAIIVAVRMGGRWIPVPPPDVQLEQGDRVIIKVYAENEDELVHRLESMGFRLLSEKVAEIE